MVLNTEWINQHLGEGDAILLVDADPQPEEVAPAAGSSVSFT